MKIREAAIERQQYNNAVVSFNANGSTSILSELFYFEKLSVLGNNNIQAFIESCLVSSDVNQSTETNNTTEMENLSNLQSEQQYKNDKINGDGDNSDDNGSDSEDGEEEEDEPAAKKKRKK
uniref:Uncharacterized protein n=1 Tax=Panagrolaimus sp. ES5 TaxID=591445 RepID=A0AC34GDQ2_9BILA